MGQTGLSSLIKNWRSEYNTIRPHSSLRYKPPAPENILLVEFSGWSVKNGRKSNSGSGTINGAGEGVSF